MNKKQLREKYKKLRSQLSKKEIDEKSIEIANQLLNLDIWNKTYYHLFLPIDHQNEVNTEYILQILQGKDKEIIVSKSNFETCEMTHFLLTDNTKFKISLYGIPEPLDGIEVPIDKFEVIFVPLLAYDKLGNRVGYGKGFYDKFLSKCKPETIKIGLSFFNPENEIDGVLDKDIRLNYCILSTKTISFF